MVKHLINPIDRATVRLSRGRLGPITGLFVPTLLVSTSGRMTGEVRTVPLIYIRDGNDYIVGNARPKEQPTNPWVLNLRAADLATVRVGRQDISVSVTELDAERADRLWPGLTRIWPALDEFFADTGERSVFALRPLD
jgi:deazaflavin-dependent oxidoreductase (nitroreductase family)